MRPFIFALTLALSLPVFAQANAQPSANDSDMSTGIIHGPNHAYMITAPKGWILDNEIWANEGIFAVFYKSGGSIDASPIVAYTMVQEKNPEGLEAHINCDMVSTLKGCKTAKIEKHIPLKTHDGRTGVVYSVTGVPNQNPEWMAYIDAPTVIILVSVSVRDIKDFQQGESILKDLVSSVNWFTDKVQYQK